MREKKKIESKFTLRKKKKKHKSDRWREKKIFI